MYSNESEVQKSIGRFMQYFNTSEKIDNAFRMLNNRELEYRNLGMNDDSIQIDTDFITFDLLYDKSGMEFENLYPFKLSISDFRNLLDSAKGFIHKYENHKIPGLIHRRDFSEWSTAPNAQINEEYLKKNYNLCKSILEEIGILKGLKEAIEIMIYSPQLLEDLENHSNLTNRENAKLKGLRLAVEQTISNKGYYGNIEGMMYSKIIDFKLEDFNLPKSIRSEIGYRVGHRDFDVAKLDELLKDWVSKLSNQSLVENLINSIGLKEYEGQLIETFYKYPNLLIELEELLTKHKEKLSKEYLKEILKSKINSKNSSENLKGYLKGKIIKFLIEKYELPDDNWKSSEELRQWSFKNDWGLTEFEEYINQKMKKNTGYNNA